MDPLSEQPQNTRPRLLRHWPKILLIVAVCAVLGRYAIRGYQFFAQEPTFMAPYTTPSLDQISEDVPVEFPPSATLVESRLQIWLSVLLWSKIEIDEADVDWFVGRLPPQSKVSRTTRLGITNDLNYFEEPAWWDPDSSREFIAAIIELPAVDYHYPEHGRILINMDDARRVVIYLFWQAGS